MSKRRIIIFASILVSALAVLIIVFLIHRSNRPSANPFKIIPRDAALIIQVNNFRNMERKVFQDNEVYHSVSGMQAFSRILNDVYIIDSLVLKVSDLGDIIYKSQFYISAHLSRENETVYLFTIHLHEDQDMKNVLKVLKEVTSQDVRKTLKKYEGREVYHFSVQRQGERQIFYLTEIEGNIAISVSRELIERSVRQYSESESLLSNKAFADMVSAAVKNVDVNIYLNLRQAPKMLSRYANSEYRSKIGGYDKFGSWMVLDLNAAPDQILLNGFISTDNSTCFNDIFRGNNPVSISADSVLPASTIAFLSVGAEDINLLNKKYEEYLKGIGKAEAREGKIKSLERSHEIELAGTLESLIEGEIALAKGPFHKKRKEQLSSIVLLRCKSGTQAFRQLSDIMGKIQTGKGGSPEQLEGQVAIDPDTRYPILKIPVEDFTGLMFGDLFSIRGTSYMTYCNNYIAFAGSEDVLEYFLYEKELKNTLSTVDAYRVFKSRLADRSFFLLYGDLSKFSGILKEYFEKDFISEWENHIEDLRKIQSSGFQITKLSGLNYGNILINYTGDAEGKPKTIWESKLDAHFSFKPQFVKNHKNTDENEIFLQDNDNNIYLISSSGLERWKQPLREAINSKVEQIDYYGNGKLQLLFSTENYIHLIDREGKKVEDFPIQLPSPATAGMALFDYEQNRDYRIFIPCADNNIYVYNMNGDPVRGWEFAGSEHRINQSPQHFRIGMKDYIVISDKYRTYILDRRGGERVPVNRLIQRSVNNTYYLNENKQDESLSTLVTTNTNGTVIHVSFKGSVEETFLGAFSSEHYFNFQDVDADGKNDYIFLDNNKLTVYRQDRTKILSHEFANAINQPPIYFEFSRSDRKLGIVDDTGRKIYLINKDGSLYKGFPLEGSTLFSIGFLEKSRGKFNLIVGGRNNFLYNYSVQ